MGKYSVMVVLSLILTMSYFLVGMNSNQKQALEESVTVMKRRQAQNIANSHARVVLNKLYEMEDNGEIFNPNDQRFKYHLDLEYVKDADIALKVDDATTSNDLFVGQFRITAKSEVDGEDAETVVYYDRKAYSYYGLFINSFNAGYYTDGEVLRGPIFSNNHFSIGGNNGPLVEGDISCSGKIKKYGNKLANWENSANFKGDFINEGVNKIPFKTKESWIDSKAENTANIDSDFKNHNGDLYLVLLPDGRVAVSILPILPDEVEQSNRMNPHWTKIYTVADLESNGNVLSSKKHNLHIEGTLSGQLSITTRKKVYIDGDVKYKDDPRLPGNEDSKDLLAIMSKGDQLLSVKRKRYYNAYGRASYRTLNPSGLEVMACMYTEGTIKPEQRSGGYRGYWKTFGSRVQHRLSATFSGNRWGFREDIDYDERLREDRPPEMPWTNKRRITSWNETY